MNKNTKARRSDAASLIAKSDYNGILIGIHGIMTIVVVICFPNIWGFLGGLYLGSLTSQGLSQTILKNRVFKKYDDDRLKQRWLGLGGFAEDYLDKMLKDLQQKSLTSEARDVLVETLRKNHREGTISDKFYEDWLLKLKNNSSIIEEKS